MPVKRLLESPTDVKDDILPISGGMQPARTTGTNMVIGMMDSRLFVNSRRQKLVNRVRLKTKAAQTLRWRTKRDGSKYTVAIYKATGLVVIT